MITWSLRSVGCVLGVGLALLGGGWAVAQTPAGDKSAEPSTAPKSAAITKLQEAEGDFPITVLPVALPGQPIELATRVEFAKGLANVLERTGMKSIEVSPDDFSIGSAPAGDLDAFAKAVATHLKQHPVETEYVYALEYCGKQGSPATAILTVLADRQGQILWKNRQGPGDATFQQFQPNNLLIGEMVSADPFRRLLKLGDPTAKEVYKGRWADYFENKRKQQVPKETSRQPQSTNYGLYGVAGGVLILVAVFITVQRSRSKKPSAH